MDSVLFINVPESAPIPLVGMFCLSCEINFLIETDYKIHYKSELHHYNLKRKMVGLPPISEERFKKSVMGWLNRA